MQYGGKMDRKEVEDISELKVRQYFDHFLENTLPEILKTHAVGCPHGKKINKVKWMVLGAAVVLSITIPAFGKTLLRVIGLI